MFPLNEEFYTSMGDSYATSADTIMCCGPFVVTSMDVSVGVTMVKNENYWDAENVKLDGIEVSFSGAFNTLVVRSRDVNGVVSGVTSILYQLGVNVANMSVCRPKRGADMLMVIEVDEHIKPSQVAFLNELPNIISVTYYDKEEEDDGTGFDEGDL